MCVNYVHYYPRVELEVCKSDVDSEALQDYFRFANDFDGQGIWSQFMFITCGEAAFDMQTVTVTVLPLGVTLNGYV